MAVPRVKSTANNQRIVGTKRDGHPDRAGAETISRLQRGILRMALAYHGQNPELDAKLKQLGVLIRNGQRDAGLQQLIDEIVDTIVSLDIGKSEAPPATAAAHAPDAAGTTTPDYLAHFLDRFDVSGPLEAELRALRRLLGEKRDSVATLAALERAAGAIVQDLGRGAAVDSAIKATRRCLIELVERIPVSHNLSSEAILIKRALESTNELAQFRPCAGAIAELVIKVREELQQEISHLAEFLRGTARRLQEFEQFMNRSRDTYAESTADALQLSETLGNGIEELRQEVSAADDLVALKTTVENRLVGIDQSLHVFMLSQNHRASEARDAIEYMSSKLKDLEQQAESLRDDLEEQHARILIDPLTGVLNRAGYAEMAGKQFARWKRYGGALSLAVLDIDLFKDINDRYGHSAGDKVLATVAAKLREHIRESDILCRYGGEEFVLLLPETAVGDAGHLLDKLRAHIEECPFRHKETPVRVTMSCGVAQFRGADALEDVFERADQAMYRAKAGGRNRLCYGHESEPAVLPRSA